MARLTPETATAERSFVEKAMALIREKAYPKVSDAVFEREWRDLLLAVSEPANYFKLRGWNGSAGIYLGVLRKALEELTASGGILRSRNRPQMLRAWLQTHLRYHGETYIERVKAVEGKATASIAARILKGLQPVAEDRSAETLTDALVAARGLLAPPPAKANRTLS